MLMPALALAACTAAATSAARPTIVVPMQVVNAMNLVSAQVNDSKYHALFLVDTGANMTLLTPIFAERMGLTVPSDARRRSIRVVGGTTISIPLVRLSRLAVGEAVAENVDVGIYDAFPQAKTIDGILGADFLNRYNVTLDKSRRRMLLEPFDP